MSAWFETAGERGVLELTRRDGSWYVAEPSPEATVKVLGTASGACEGDRPARRRLRGTVSSYKRGTGDRPDVLFLTDVVAAPDAEPGSDPTAEGRTAPDAETPDETAAEASSIPSLERIAREEIGDRELRQADEESLVDGARRRASEQHRAPAIDPRLQDGRDDIGKDG
jgi:hypothetical protein